MLECKRLLELLSYDEETGHFKWKVNRTYTAKAGIVAGRTTHEGYRELAVGGRYYRAHRVAWLYVYGVWPKKQLDHINGIRNDNRIINLREATGSQNRGNSKNSASNTTGLKGVTFAKYSRKWQASIAGKYIGQFSTAKEAHLAYRQAAVRIYGEFARFE